MLDPYHSDSLDNVFFQGVGRTVSVVDHRPIHIYLFCVLDAGNCPYAVLQ